MSNLSDRHWLRMDDERRITGCQCGFAADTESDAGYGDSVVAHLFDVAAAEALTKLADAWQWGGWTVLTAPDRGLMDKPQRVTDWLRERASGGAA